MKKAVSVVLALLLCTMLSVITTSAKTSYNVSVLENCQKLYADSNSTGAYAYGFYNNTLCVARLIPNAVNRYIAVGGNIKSVCQNGKYTCALYQNNYNTYPWNVAVLNSDNGNCTNYSIRNFSYCNSISFSVSDDKMFFIKTDSAYAYAVCYKLNGDFVSNYTFSQSVIKLFNNNGNTYARLYDGSVYRLESNDSVYCTAFDKNAEFYNAGTDWLGTDTGMLVSLNGNNSITSYATADYFNAVYGNNRYYTAGKTIYKTELNNNVAVSADIDSTVKFITAHNDLVAVVTNLFDCIVLEKSDFKSDIIDSNSNNNSNDQNFKSDYKFTNNDIIYGIKSGTSVKTFKSGFSVSVLVLDDNSKNVTSGNIKTGQRAVVNDNTFALSVLGDVTGEGNVKSNDVTAFMLFLLGDKDLNGAYKQSADVNMDGSINNKDLVLMAQTTDK